MKVVVLSLVLGLALTGGEKLATKYSSERDLRYEIALSTTLEMTSMEGERDGEPIEAPNHGSKNELESREVHVDHVLEVADGKPTKVRRAFEKVGGTAGFTMGENSRDTNLESPFEGVTLELTATKDGVEAEVVEGTKPEGEGALEGHGLDSFVDALLPADEVAVDATWDLEKADVARAMRLDVRRVLFPRPQREGGGGEGGGGGGRRGGMRGGGPAGLLDDAEWKGTAKLIAVDKEIDGLQCSVVELKLDAEGEREMPAPRMRGGAFGPSAALLNSMSYSVHLEGTFAFANKERRPVKLDLAGELRMETNVEFSNDEHSMKMHTISEGKLEFTVDVSEEKPKTAKADK